MYMYIRCVIYVYIYTDEGHRPWVDFSFIPELPNHIVSYNPFLLLNKPTPFWNTYNKKKFFLSIYISLSISLCCFRWFFKQARLIFYWLNYSLIPPFSRPVLLLPPIYSEAPPRLRSLLIIELSRVCIWAVGCFPQVCFYQPLHTYKYINTYIYTDYVCSTSLARWRVLPQACWWVGHLNNLNPPLLYISIHPLYPQPSHFHMYTVLISSSRIYIYNIFRTYLFLSACNYPWINIPAISCIYSICYGIFLRYTHRRGRSLAFEWLESPARQVFSVLVHPAAFSAGEQQHSESPLPPFRHHPAVSHLPVFYGLWECGIGE